MLMSKLIIFLLVVSFSVFLSCGKAYTFEKQKSVLNENKVDISQIPVSDALIIGNENSKYKIIVFDDPD